MSDPYRAVSLPPFSRQLTTADGFHRLAEVPAEIEWFANIDNPRRGVPIEMPWRIL